MNRRVIKLFSATTLGVDGFLVEVEVDIQNGLPKFEITGLADSTIREAKERVRSAIINSGFQFPLGRIIVNLAPADLRKEGTHFDIVIALGILLSSRQVNGSVGNAVFAGELALDGSIRAVKGVLPMTESAIHSQFERVIVPRANALEASLISQIEIIAVASLRELVDHIENKGNYRFQRQPLHVTEVAYDLDFSDVIGQQHAKKGILIACAGGHHMIMVGPPGAGKSMLARRAQTILPELDAQQVFEVRKIQSIAGHYIDDRQLDNQRPFRAPHHTITAAGLAGGQSPPKPGEITLAHHGVLFLDELTEFSRQTLEILRQPLEEGAITIVRGKHSVRFPSKFILICATNPCNCGYYGSDKRECTCKDWERKRYMNKISGPFRDRFDLQVEVQEVEPEVLMTGNVTGREMSEKDISAKERDVPQMGSAAMREQVRSAWERQWTRQNKLNGDLSPKEMETHLHLDADAQSFIQRIYQQMNLSMRGYHKVLRVARTLADIAGADKVTASHLAETVTYRSLQKY